MARSIYVRKEKMKMDKEKLANDLTKSLLKMAVDLEGMCVIISDEFCTEETQKEAGISLEQVRGLLADKSPLSGYSR